MFWAVVSSAMRMYFCVVVRSRLHGLHVFHRIEVGHVVGGEPATEVVEAVPLALTFESRFNRGPFLKQSKLSTEKFNSDRGKHRRRLGFTKRREMSDDFLVQEDLNVPLPFVLLCRRIDDNALIGLFDLIPPKCHA